MFSCLNHANLLENSYLEKNVGCCVSFLGEYISIPQDQGYDIYHCLSYLSLNVSHVENICMTSSFH